MRRSFQRGRGVKWPISATFKDGPAGDFFRDFSEYFAAFDKGCFADAV
jgi:hypothetical protein